MQRQAPDRVFANHDHALQEAGSGPVNHLDERRAGRERQLGLPSTAHLGTGLRTRHVQPAREEFGHSSHFDRALIVVFFRQGSEAAARFLQFAREQKQVEELEAAAVAAGAS